MIRTLPLALLALAAAAPAAAAERTYSVTDFDRIQVDGPYRVTVTVGSGSSARAEGSAEALDHLSVDVQGGILRVRRNRSAWGGYPGEGAGSVAIALTTRDLRNAAVVGSGSLDIDRAQGPSGRPVGFRERPADGRRGRGRHAHRRPARRRPDHPGGPRQAAQGHGPGQRRSRRRRH